MLVQSGEMQDNMYAKETAVYDHPSSSPPTRAGHDSMYDHPLPGTSPLYDSPKHTFSLNEKSEVDGDSSVFERAKTGSEKTVKQLAVIVKPRIGDPIPTCGNSPPKDSGEYVNKLSEESWSRICSDSDSYSFKRSRPVLPPCPKPPPPACGKSNKLHINLPQASPPRSPPPPPADQCVATLDDGYVRYDGGPTTPTTPRDPELLVKPKLCSPPTASGSPCIPLSRFAQQDDFTSPVF